MERRQKQKKERAPPDDHENLGSFIIKNTKYDGGMTQILEDDGLDPQVISDLVKGVHSSIMAIKYSIQKSTVIEWIIFFVTLTIRV